MARAVGARAQMALAFESVYGTAPTTGFRAMSFVSAGLGAEQPLLEDDRLGQGRDPLAPVKDAVTVSGDVVAPLEVESVGMWLKALFGAPTSVDASGVYTHTFNSGGWTLPSMAIEIGTPEIPRFAMYEGVRANSMSLQMQRSGLPSMTVGLIGREETVAGTTAAGSPTAFGAARFGSFNGSIARNGTPLGEVVSASVDYSNNLDPVEVIAADGLIAGLDPGRASMSGQIVTRFADLTLYNQAVAGDACELVFSYEVSASVKLTITAHAVYLPRPRVAIDGPGGLQATFDWIAAKDTDPARMATVALVNGVASY